MSNLLHLPWDYLIIFVAIECLILWVFDKFEIIKSKPLRFLIVTFVYTLIFWIVYDFVLAPQ